MTATVVPAVVSVPMDRQSKKISAGQTVPIGIQIKDIGIFGVSTLLDPTEIPTISIINPLDIEVVTDAVMSFISKGRYTYYHITDTSNALGQYMATFNVVNLNEAARLERVGVFVIETAGSFSIFSFLRIKDQTGQIFFWWIDLADTLDNSLTSPTHPSKLPVDLDTAFVPEFLEIINAGGLTRFVFPDITGSPTVSSSAPGGGAGRSYIGCKGPSTIGLCSICSGDEENYLRCGDGCYGCV